jgi:ADP-heptose:LPS heptosyltransferase
MKTVLLSPYSRKLRSGARNPKDYPYADELVGLMTAKGVNVVQVGGSGEEPVKGVSAILTNLSLERLEEELFRCDTWVSADTFLQHFAWYHGKKGVAIFGQSDPIIFGHNTNVNILKSRSYLRPFQFDMWENCLFNADAFVKADVVMESVKSLI